MLNILWLREKLRSAPKFSFNNKDETLNNHSTIVRMHNIFSGSLARESKIRKKQSEAAARLMQYSTNYFLTFS